ncbi:MAG: preprotein translocase subunit SecG [Candidatus Omnitrophica bacterium]|nr:preprotein translocase subunit SecG [Candidatus Omnitrophota bacterium]
MMILLIIIHVIACVVLIGLVLIQRGRGAGLVESFAGVESMFGTKTSAFLTRTTTIMSVVFFMTCLSLAVLSVKQSKSLMRNVHSPAPKSSLVTTEPAKTPSPKPQTVTSEAIKVQTPPPPAPVNAPAEKLTPDAAKSQ